MRYSDKTYNTEGVRVIGESSDAVSNINGQSLRKHLSVDARVGRGGKVSKPGSSGKCNRRFKLYNPKHRDETGSSGGTVVKTPSVNPGDRRILKRLRRSVPLVLSLEKRIRKAAMWFQVTIHHGGNFRKNYVLAILMANVEPTEFIPICYRVTGRNSSFFVDDCNAAEKLASLKDEIAIRGQTLLVEVRPGLPQVVTDSTAMERMKTVIARRHDASSRSLDLSRLHTDADLVDNFPVALFVPSMMLAVVDVVAENFPDLEALDLSQNKLYLLENLSALPSKLPNLKVLDLGRNMIPEMRKLDWLKGLPLEELVLAGNPLTSKYEDDHEYVSDARKRFPRLKELDETVLFPPIFDDLQMAKITENYSSAAEGAGFISRVLQLAYSYIEKSILVLKSTLGLGQSCTDTSA